MGGGKARVRDISSEQLPVLIVRDRSDITSGAILSRVTANALAEVLMPLFDSDVILCSDRHRRYQAFSRTSGVSLGQLTYLRGVV